MKQKITLLTALLANVFVSEAQITINASDIPLPSTVNIMQYASATSLPTGANQSWNTSANAQVGPTSLTYQAESVPFWLNLGADVYRQNSKYLTSSLTYNIFLEFDKNANGVDEIGFNIPAQSYGIGSFTGSNSDSIIFADHDVQYTTAKTIMPFPMTSTSSFGSTGRRVVSFAINAPALGLNNTPFTHVLNEVRKDSVIGWGKMRVYMPGGVSQPYDVLMDRITQYSLDSFYMAGSPAPATLLTAFGVTQGQKVNIGNAIHFYRKGHFNYLYRLYFGDDNTFTNFNGAFSDLDDLNFPTSIGDHKSTQFTSIVYPNPCTSADLHFKLLGSNFSEYELYTITNPLGVTINSAAINATNDEIILPTKNLSTGVYYINIYNSKTGAKISETIQVN